MDENLKRLYNVMLLPCTWIKQHEILINDIGWIEEHTIQTVDEQHRTFEIRFNVDAIRGYMEIVNISMNYNVPYNIGQLMA